MIKNGDGSQFKLKIAITTRLPIKRRQNMLSKEIEALYKLEFKFLYKLRDLQRYSTAPKKLCRCGAVMLRLPCDFDHTALLQCHTFAAQSIARSTMSCLYLHSAYSNGSIE